MLDRTKPLDRLKKKNGPQNEPEPNVRIGIAAPKFRSAIIKITGTAPYVQNKMSRRQFEKMRAEMELGPVSRSKRVRVAKKFQDLHKEAIHVSQSGWSGIPATAFRQALIDACRLVGYQMTKAKMSVFIVPDGFDKDDGQPLVRINGGEPRALEMVVRLPNGKPDIAVRPQWMKWEAAVKMRWDADQFSDGDVLNLMARAGEQVGIGAGRPFSKESVGMGWGTWSLNRSGSTMIQSKKE